MTPEQAIDVVARQVLASAASRLLDDDQWEDYPELGENDWAAVTARMKALAPTYPDEAEYREAYALLESRAGHGDERAGASVPVTPLADLLRRFPR